MKKKDKSQRTECQIFSRVCGWLVPRKSMNLGKQSEFKDRQYFKYEKRS